MKLVNGKIVDPSEINGPIDVIDDENGRWWLRCLSKTCDGNFGVLDIDPNSVEVSVEENRLDATFSGPVVCGKCGGKMEKHRVEVNVTIDANDEMHSQR